MAGIQAAAIITWAVMEQKELSSRSWYFFYGFVTYHCIVNIWRCIFPPNEK